MTVLNDSVSAWIHKLRVDCVVKRYLHDAGAVDIAAPFDGRHANLVRWRSLRATLGPCNSHVGPVPVSSVVALLSESC